MSSMEKLALRMKSDMASLQKVIEIFVFSFSPNKIIKKFRYNSSIFEKIDKSLIKEIIFYTVCKQLNSFVSEDEQKRQKILIKQLRSNYWQLSVSIWKKQLNFQLWMVFITKIICSFYHQHFTDVFINDKIEAQIYIILIHSFIGLNVNTKCYQILSAKYYTSKNTNSSSLRIKKSVPIIAKKTKMLKKMNSNSSTIFSHCRKLDNDFDTNRLSVEPVSQEYVELRSFLKNNLRCSSLPKVKSSKKTIESMYYNEPDQKTPDLNIKQYYNEMKKKVIQSTQTSTSFQNQLLSHDINFPSQAKSFKIPHRIQLKSNHTSQNRRSIYKQLNNSLPLCQNQKCQLKSVGFQNWQKVVKKLKVTGCEENMKLELSSLFPNREKRDNQEKQNLYSETNLIIMTPKEQLKQKKGSDKNLQIKKEQIEKQKEPPIKLDYFTRDFKQINMVTCNYFQKKKKKQTEMKSHELRLKKVEFQKSNELRTRKIEYSIFMLPNDKEKLKYFS